MKEFICVLKQTDKVTRQNLWNAIYSPFMGAIGGGILSVLSYCMQGAWFTAEVFLAVGAMLGMFLVHFLIIFPTDFTQALSMGKARKYLFPTHYVLCLRNTLVSMLCILGICLIRDYAYSHLEDGALILNEWSILSNPLIFVTIVLCVPALILFLGGMRLFFGVKMYWGFLGLFMILIGFTKLKEKYSDVTVLRWLRISGGEPNVVVICLLCLLCGVMMLGLAWLVLRKQRVVCG